MEDEMEKNATDYTPRKKKRKYQLRKESVGLPGRPTKMTEDKLAEIKQAFSFGLKVDEVVAMVGIGRQTMYDYFKFNPAFKEECYLLRDNPKIKAKMNIYKDIKKGDVNTSKWYLERTDDDFSNKNKTEIKARVSNANIMAEMTAEELRAIIAGGSNDGN